MATSTIKTFLVTLVLLCSISESLGFCNILATKFRLLGCARGKQFPCRLIDAKMRLLRCRYFGCEGYRDLQTFCSTSCGGLEISNGICPLLSKCCLNSVSGGGGVSGGTGGGIGGGSSSGSNSLSLDDFRSIPGPNAYELMSTDAGTMKE